MSLNQAVEDLNNLAMLQLKALERVEDERRKLTIGCGCGQEHVIGELKLIRTHWYTSPHGCTGGDYWNEGEWQFVCPVDNVRERIMFNSYYWVPYDERQKMSNPSVAFRRLYWDSFGERIDTHGDDEERAISPRHRNNYYVDLHQAKFGLPIVTNPNAK